MPVLVVAGGDDAKFTAEGRLVTRPATAAILNGITRGGLIRVLAEQQVTMEERPFSLA